MVRGHSSVDKLQKLFGCGLHGLFGAHHQRLGEEKEGKSLVRVDAARKGNCNVKSSYRDVVPTSEKATNICDNSKRVA